MLGPRRLLRELRAHRDPEQRRLAEPELLALVPALEAQPGVPVQVAGVRPVARQHALGPRAHDAGAPGVQRRHAGVARLPVGDQEAADDVRVLGGVEVVLVRLRRLGEIVEAIARAEVGHRRAVHRARRAVDEALELQQQLAVQVLAVAAHRRRRLVHPRVPVDLVQPQRRPAPEGARGRGDDAVGDQVRGAPGRARAPRARATRSPAPTRPRCRPPGAASDARRASPSSRGRGPAGRRRAPSATPCPRTAR